MAVRLTTFVVIGIVAATLIAGFIVGAQRDDSDGPIDLIIHNGAVYSADAAGTMAAGSNFVNKKLFLQPHPKSSHFDDSFGI
jgi:hypothetical protein